jgi:cytochrome P450
MSATSLGGSLNLVKTDDRKLKNMFLNRLKRAAFDASVPFIRYLPFVPPQSPELSEMIGEIVAKRRAEKEPKNDLLQIFLDANKSDPTSFSELHIEEEMVLFM